MARRITADGHEETQIELSSAMDYCALLLRKGCLAEGEFVLSLTLDGTTPGTYRAPTPQGDERAFSVLITTIEKNCTGPGLGSADGTIQASEVKLAQGGVVSLTIDADVLFSRMRGSVTAPYCPDAGP